MAVHITMEYSDSEQVLKAIGGHISYIEHTNLIAQQDA
jgi:hypothetical protein